MPTATVPLSKPGSPTTPAAGLTRPAGFNRPVQEEKEEVPTPTWLLVVSWIVVIIMLVFCYQQFTIDQHGERHTEPTLGWPSDSVPAAGDEDGGDAPAASSDEDDE